MKRPVRSLDVRRARPARRALIVAFDIARERDPVPSLAVGSLLAYARTRPGHGRAFEVLHHSVRVDAERALDPGALSDEIASAHELRSLDVIALSAYAWSEAAIDPLMRELRRRGFRGDFAVGGYQVTRTVDLSALYPDARYLIEGPAERELLRVLLQPPAERILVGEIDVADLVSPYLAGAIEVLDGAPMVRMETQRGCRWRCRFCSYRGRGEANLVQLPIDRVARELRLFAEHRVAKVNVLDPEFNWSRNCLPVLRAMVDAELGACITVQARPENLVKARWGPEFLDLCADLDIHLEFGLQTAVPVESVAVDRRNDLDAVSRAFYEVGARGISFEVSLIYGLPLQTVESFAASIEFVRRHGVPSFKCFPLMLHRGTPLALEREKWRLREEVLDGFGIPYVTSSTSFTRSDWEAMRALAEGAAGPPDVGGRLSPASSNLPGGR
jgi:radical SAM superfamily enzyme YgiQ (UPF0313 family)